MSKKVPVLVLDTNVWVDDALAFRPGHQAASMLIYKARAHGVELAYGITSMKDVFYLVTLTCKRYLRDQEVAVSEGAARACIDTAWDVTEKMTELATPIGADLSDVWFARKLRNVHNDLEDNFVVAAAERADADYIVTSDQGLLSNPHVRTMRAEDMLEHLRLLYE